MVEAKIGVVGGSGLYEIEGLRVVDEVDLDTPFGKPSDTIRVGELSGQRVAFLPRHGRGHRIMPSELNSRANIFALKLLGVEQVIAVSAVGSLREELRPLDIVVPDQLFDRTKNRPNTFYGEGIVVHVGFAEPFCLETSALLAEVGEGVRDEGPSRLHRGGAYVCIEGPQFSTKAESRVYRQWGMDIIGMTAIPEAKLAREAEMCYAMLALVTDYDVWHESAEPVSVEMVVANLLANVATAKAILAAAAPRLGQERQCPCRHALRDAIMTAPDRIPEPTREALRPLIGKYL